MPMVSSRFEKISSLKMTKSPRNESGGDASGGSGGERSVKRRKPAWTRKT